MSEVFKYSVFDQNNRNIGFLVVGMEVRVGDRVEKENRGVKQFSGIVYVVEESADETCDANLRIKPIPD